jgi:tetratricopeptide (TPR) repeat protein
MRMVNQRCSSLGWWLVLAVAVAFPRLTALAQNQTAAPQGFAEGQALVAAKKPAEAAEKFEAVVAAQPEFAPGWYALAAARRRAGQCDRAIGAYRRYAHLQPKEVEPYYGLGLCLHDTGDDRGAVEALTRYVHDETRPSAQPWVNHARSVLADLGAPAGGAAAAPSSAETPPGGPKAIPAAKGAGTAKVPAVAKVSPPPPPAETPPVSPPGTGAAKADAPSPALGAYNEAQSLRDRGHINEAIAKFRQAISEDPAHMPSRAALGELLIKIRRDDEAITVFRGAVDKNPSYPLAWYELAFALRVRGRMAEAVDAYKRYIKLRPSDPDPYFGLARALQKLGRTQEAAKAYETYVSLEKRPSEDKWVKLANAQLRSLSTAGP